MRIEGCFDSHVHWAATGEFSERLALQSLSAPAEVRRLKIENAHRRGEWLLGFGWDETSWPQKPHRSFLDAVYPNEPVAFSRCDGHALWVNSEALRLAGLFNANRAEELVGRMDRDDQGLPTGVLLDKARERVDAVIPKMSSLELRRCMLKGIKIFNRAGFTHIRDMTCDEFQWVEALRLDDSGLLTLAVEEYFWLKDLAQLKETLELANSARAQQSANLRVKGLKVFLDGALGSEGAWLSKCYHGSTEHGVLLWQKAELREVLLECWAHNFEVAVHAIGDESADLLLDIVLNLKSEGQVGAFHIEHAELLRPQTIAKMAGLQVACHLQPAHWLSDQHWLKDKIGDLAQFAFPWRRLQEANIEFDFGSDSPIEPASLNRTYQALRQSAEAGIPRLLGLPHSYMGHKDLSWAPNSYTLMDGDAPIQVVFRGEHVQ